MKANDILENGDTSIVIFTDGRNLTINGDGTGKSGNWVINRSAEPSRVIIYLRKPAGNEIYIGDFVRLSPSTERHLPHRLAVDFINLDYKGKTELNWNQFTDTKHGAVSPIKYVSKN